MNIPLFNHEKKLLVMAKKGTHPKPKPRGRSLPLIYGLVRNANAADAAPPAPNAAEWFQADVIPVKTGGDFCS